MTAEHLSQIQLVGYEARTLNAEELLAVDRHLASCDACHDKLADLASGHSYDLLTDEEPFHLDYDQHLAPYVDGVADEIDREIIESHIALCSQCAEDIRDLKEFRKQPSLQAVPVVKVSRWTQWTNQWQWSPRLAAAVAVAILIPGITTAVLLWTKYQPLPQASIPEQLPGNDNGAGRVAVQPSPESPGDGPVQPKEPLVALNDGARQITLDENGHSKGLESLPPDLRTTIENVLASRKFNLPPALFNLSESTGKLRGDTETEEMIEQLAPVRAVIESDRPVFRWGAFADASEYVVSVIDSKLRLVESSGSITGTEWTILKPLKRGETYSWQISAIVNGKTVISPKPPAPETQFKVLDKKAFGVIENARREQGNSHLTMAVLYWRYGLIEAAEREAQALVRANPGSPVAADLLRSLRALRRR
ncbi:MAG TPA: zf-HC2 domain-containing protein [Pyrinomonadaceae bacterium]|nr:zf-HC2 domain-containing protein [Pyrinomonadaceae bacterium]